MSLTHSESIIVNASPESLYDLVSDVTRTGEWSPVCTSCWWDEGDSARVGAHFTGHNELPERTWETHCEVVAAERGKEFAFVVGNSFSRWGYRLEPVDGGTSLTESWEFLPGGIALFGTRYGDSAQEEIDLRTKAAHEGIPVTIAAIKAIAESVRPTS